MYIYLDIYININRYLYSRYLHIDIYLWIYIFISIDIYIPDIYIPRYLRLNIDILYRYLFISNSLLDIHLTFLMPVATALYERLEMFI